MYLKVVLTGLLVVAAIIAVQLTRTPPRPGPAPTVLFEPSGPPSPAAESSTLDMLPAGDPTPSLAKRMARFDVRTPRFHRALAALGEQSGANLSDGTGPHVDPRRDLDPPLEVHLSDVTVETALRVLVDQLNSRVAGGSPKFGITTNYEYVVVAPAAPPVLPPVTSPAALKVTRFYNVRDLLRNASSWRAAGATATGGRVMLESVAQLIATIEESVAPASWERSGGREGYVHEWEGVLVITQTLDNHREIGRLLEDLRRAVSDSSAAPPATAPSASPPPGGAVRPPSGSH